ncbi:mechanosensitive ion channel family protein [Sphingomonas lenta]|nr:mechanosensitive ion channel family protein [Sphingomonas lenta]
MDRLLDDFLAMLPLLFAGLLAFLLLWLIAKVVRAGLERVLARSSNRSAATAIGRIAYVLLLALAVLISVTVAFPSMTPGRLISVLGVGGIAIGFAFKDIFQNLLAGILLLLRHPFRVGDEITTGEFTGTVEAIETRATHIRTYDGKRVITPNGDVYTKPVTVISAYDMLRSEYDVGIGYGDDLGKAKEIALEAIRSVEGVLEDPTPDVLVWELAGSSKNLRLRWWTRPQRGEVLHVRDRVLRAAAEALSGAGVDLPFPTQVVLFHDQTEATDGDRRRQREGWPAGDSPPEPRPLSRVELVRSDGERGDGDGRS